MKHPTPTLRSSTIRGGIDLFIDRAVWRRGGQTRTACLLFIAGLLCLQAAWMITVPPFRGIDEIDHAYRAASVARGDLGPATDPVPNGRGRMVAVPADMVEAARPACAQLKYVGRGNCEPATSVRPDGTVGIASSAGAYMPLYYALVGWPSQFVGGEVALYAMRLASLLLCDLFLLLAAMIALRRRSPWHLAGLAVCLTPTVLYASITAAPNAISMAGGLLMWVAWTAADPGLPRRENHSYAWLGTVGAVTTSITHNTGPIWVLVTVMVTAWLWRPWPHPRRVLRALWPQAGMILAGFGIAVLWTRYSGANSLAEEWHSPSQPAQWHEILMLPVRWLFQSIFGAPRPGGMTTGFVYGLAFTLIFLIVVLGFQRAESKVRQAMVFIAVTLTALPLALTWLTYDDLGFAWQGRYSIPLGVGITLLAAASLNRTRSFKQLHVLGIVPLGIVHVGAILSARANVAAEDAAFLSPEWVAPALCIAGALWWVACLRSIGHGTDVRADDASSAVAARV